MKKKELDIHFYKQSFLHQRRDKKRYAIDWQKLNFFQKKEPLHRSTFFEKTPFYESVFNLTVIGALFYYMFFYTGMPIAHLENILDILSYTSGFYMGLKSAFLLKESHPHAHISKKSMAYMVAAALIIAMPTLFLALLYPCY